MANREYENSCLSLNYKYIAGTDEAGRGPLAGPLVVASVILPNTYNNSLINDSKKLTDKKRRVLFDEIIRNCLSFSIVVIDSKTIDSSNIYKESQKGMISCINKLKIKPDVVLSDAMKLPTLDMKVIDIVKGDSKSISIAAASILAKVARDNIMNMYDKIYPNYGFSKNKGYGTKKHFEALQKYSFTPIHRKTYEPIKSMVNKQLKFDI